MSADEILVSISHAVGRIESRQEADGEMFRTEIAAIKADVAALKARPARNWAAVGKWAAGITATIAASVVAAVLMVRFGIRR